MSASQAGRHGFESRLPLNFTPVFLDNYRKIPIFEYQILAFAIVLFDNFINRALSSAGSEHLPYKQGVVGSNPSAPTDNQSRSQNSLFLLKLKNYFFPNRSLACLRQVNSNPLAPTN
jgi:hypothetical protein